MQPTARAGGPVGRATRTRRRVVVTLGVLATLLLVGSCSEEQVQPGDITGFWFFSYDVEPARSDADGVRGEAFAYVSRQGIRLTGGVASPPLGGPLSGRLEGRELTMRVEDTRGAPVVSVEGSLRGQRAEGRFAAETGERRSGSFEAQRFVPGAHPESGNPFLGTWNNFEDGGETTLVFDEEFRFTGSEGDLAFSGRYAYDRERGLVGVYEADESTVHMEMLTFRFENTDTVVLNGSTYRRQ